MMKLQEMIDAAFGSKQAHHEPQLASDAFKTRERAFTEQARKIEALRQIRLADPGRPAELHVFEVVRYRGHWRTLHCSKRSSPFSDQASAIMAAKKLAKAQRKQGNAVKVILRRTDGEEVIQPIDDETNPSAS